MRNHVVVHDNASVVPHEQMIEQNPLQTMVAVNEDKVRLDALH